jgi:alkylated DNA repair dioxygenase AlkB
MSDLNLFASEKNSAPYNLSLPNADIIYFSDFYSSEEASALFEILLKEIDWQQDNIKVFGKIYKQPRLTALYGDDGASYSYSGITMFPKPFNAALKRVKSKIEEVSEVKFNTVLLNLYRDGSDSNGWHSDDEKELGHNPVIASLSLGTERVFQLRQRKDKKHRENLLLKNGSLLLMAGATQHHWQHCIPKSKKVMSPRINLTFRILK